VRGTIEDDIHRKDAENAERRSLVCSVAWAEPMENRISPILHKQLNSPQYSLPAGRQVCLNEPLASWGEWAVK